MLSVRRIVGGLFVLVSGMVFAGRAAAQTHSDWHFLDDTERRARVDDAGGIDESYAFDIGYDPDDSNSENFCPHCRLDILVSDPGIKWSDLEALGVTREELGTWAGLASAIDRVTSESPATIAADHHGEVSGPDLDLLLTRLEELQTGLFGTTDALETALTIAGGTFSWSGVTLADILPALGIRMDTAFIASFNDPNDLERRNTGVKVYSLTEFLTALAASDPTMHDIAETLFSSIPSLPGTFEISGDDGADGETDRGVLDPAIFHGRYTDLTVKQRTYVVNGNNVHLVVYNLVNDTDRVLPLVEAAMIADFDIPPGSSDTETGLDPATFTVMTYDTLPYEDPEQHWYFGVSPASLSLAPQPFDFVIANVNLDDQLSLTQSNSTSQDNRYKYMLWSPDFTGDHDEATGKSEKQGAVSLVLPTPMLPGDERQLAFCFAGAMDTGKTAAMAKMLALQQACRALYQLLVPNCGNSVRQFGEQCDDGNRLSGDGCSADCQQEICGDANVTGGEQCDDGNTAAGDGCGATCRIEICGNAVLDPGEECDDGNLSNTDACLNDCRSARCGDGFLRVCDPATESCGCAGFEYCMHGTFTMAASATAGRLAPLVGVPIDYLIAFDSTSETPGTRAITVVTGPVHVEMTGDPEAVRMATALTRATWRFTIDTSGTTSAGFHADPLVSSTSPFDPQYAIDFDAVGRGMSARVNALGIPIVSSLRFRSATVTLDFVNTRTSIHDTVTGTGSGGIYDSSATAGGETCDDGNGSDYDACTNSCVPHACGDGFVQASEGEQCDDGNTTAGDGCNATCQRENLVACGNGITDPGETCDDGNLVDNDGCSALCLDESCGDGVVQTSEQCDDGMNGSGDGCSDACVLESCGDGTVQPGLGEECDAAAGLSDTGPCTTACLTAVCGDGFVQAGVEECDDGNAETGDGCTADCLAEVCGDGLPGPGEECDDGNTTALDGCDAACRREFCGDGMLQTAIGEQCDDGNVAAGDGCSRDCQLENAAACGNGRIDRGEQCDDGNVAAGDGCNPFCQLENPGLCGNRRVDPGEQCDDGNNTSGDGCTANCNREVCGDGIQQVGEECDDGNNTDGDGCSATCRAERPVCGNGIHQFGEQCDDGNTIDGDGCSAECVVEDPTTIDYRRNCGNGVLDPGEQCDDGNRDGSDGCDETCQLEPAVCANGRVEWGEACDDGNTAVGDGCDQTCGTAVCGDGILQAPEQCDDGNTAAGDGCNATCLIEPRPVPSSGCSCSVPASRGALGLIGLALLAAALFERRRGGGVGGRR